MDEIVIKIENLNKDFKLPHERRDSLKERLLNFRHKSSFEMLHALKDISLDVKKGEFFGIVGRNGSGKSTLLKIIGGIYQPTKGSVKVNGTLTPFIELGIGFNPELTGRENVFLNGAIMGLMHKEIAAKYQEIVDFAELEKFMDQKLKNYSSGMQVRLAFSIAIQAHNDILLIDEVLAVGDANFQRKCFNVFKDIKKSGKTVIFVTHDMGAVQEFCDRAMLIDNGGVVTIGKSGEVARNYNELNALEQQVKKPASEVKKDIYRAIEVTSTATKSNDKVTNKFRPRQYVDIIVEYYAREPVDNPVMGVTIKDLTGRPLIALNTRAEGIHVGKINKGEVKKVRFSIKNVLSDGTYSVSPAVASKDTKFIYDWVEEACMFDVVGWDFPAALIQPEHTVKIEK